MARLRDRRPAFVAAAGMAVFLLGCAGPSPRVRRAAEPALDSAVLDPEMLVAQLVEAHNRERAQHSLAPLAENPSLDAAARRHVNDMTRRHSMTHRGGDGSSSARRIEAEGYRYRRAGENIAAGQDSVESVMSEWMRSPGHRRNILGTYTEIGASYATAGDGTSYWCVTFGSREGS